MDSAFILDSIRKKYSESAIVPELTISDLDWLELHEPGQRRVKERRIDALMFQSFQRTAIEVKVSEADFKRDTWAKRRPWARVVHRFIYAVPHDMRATAPYGCGLWRISPDGKVAVSKKALVQKHPEHLPQEVVQRLAYRAAQ